MEVQVLLSAPNKILLKKGVFFVYGSTYIMDSMEKHTSLSLKRRIGIAAHNFATILKPASSCVEILPPSPTAEERAIRNSLLATSVASNRQARRARRTAADQTY